MSRLKSRIVAVVLMSFCFLGAALSVSAGKIESTVDELCKGLDDSFQKRKWGSKPCQYGEWKTEKKSVLGRPLLYTVFGPEDAKNTTLIISMVHGDEITPLYVGFKVVEWAKENMKKYPDARLVVAPLVNPDGFFEYPKTRTNARGVDCNRNFATLDWEENAIRAWKQKFHSQKRRFPGKEPESEPETLFQKELIERFKPDKILSIHSPLNMIDYDGPSHLKLAHFSEEYIKKCQELRTRIKAKSTGYFPGSLGNYAGHDLGIPTITLELPTIYHTRAKKYWEVFKKGIVTVVTHDVYAEVKSKMGPFRK